MEQISETDGRRGRRRDPIRSTGKKWEPIGLRSASDDGVNGVFKLANERIGVRRRGIDVAGIGGG